MVTAFTISTAQAQRAGHYLNICSEAGSDALIKVHKEVKNQSVKKLQPFVDAADVIALLDSTVTQKVTLLSTAYFYAMSGVDFDDLQAKLRRENAYVTRQAAQYPDRLVAFCGVNPLSEYALGEIEWTGIEGRFTGLKLHLANFNVNLRNPDHGQRMAEVFKTANRLDLVIIIRLWTRNPDYGRKDVNIMLDNILSQALYVPVQVAHLGGPGTFSKVTRAVAAAFTEFMEDREA